MNSVLGFIIGALQITVLDLVLCGDNVGVIALATRNLPQRYAKRASAIGTSCAVLLRIFFAAILIYIISIQWLPIKLVGGLILVKITWDFVKPREGEEDTHVNQSNKFWGAVTSIIIADISMSLDNVLAIASAAKGNLWLMVFGLLLNIPIIFFGSQIVVKLMKKYPIVVYIGGGLLAHTAFSMILEDRFIAKYFPHMLTVAISFIMGAAVVVYGIYVVKKNRNEKNNIEANINVANMEVNIKEQREYSEF